MRRILPFFLCWLFVLISPAPIHGYYTNMPASVVIGQNDFLSSTAGPTQLSPSAPQDIVIVGNKLIVADQSNNRILIWNTIPSYNGTPADVVLGQPDFTSSTSNNGGRSASSLSNPSSISSDGTRLFAADRGNHRVLIWNRIPTTNQAAADIVVGQTSFTVASAPVPTASTLNTPESVFTDGSKMFIADSNNRRILIFNTIPTANTPAADLVLGQPGFTTSVINNGGVSAQSMAYVHTAYYDGQRLYVSDESNSRIMVWNSLPTTNFAAADFMIGQPDATSNSVNQGGAASGNTVSAPNNMVVHNNRLFVADQGNHRVLIFNTVPTGYNASADLVLGQPNLVSSTANNGGISAQTLNNATHVLPFGDKLYVSDQSNARLLVFTDVHTTPQIAIEPTTNRDQNLRISGSIQLGERPRYALHKMLASVNGSGWSPVTYTDSGRDDGSDSTRYEFYHDFAPWANNGTRETWSERGYTVKFKAVSYNADSQQLFIFEPFVFEKFSGDTASIRVNKYQWNQLKENLESFEIHVKQQDSDWTPYVKNIRLTDAMFDPHTGTVTLTALNPLPIVTGTYEMKMSAVDMWGHRQSSNSLRIPLQGIRFAVPHEETLPSSEWFPLQINSIDGIPQSILSSFGRTQRVSFVSSTSTPRIQGVAFSGSIVKMVVYDSALQKRTYFATAENSRWSITPSLFPDSVIAVSVTHPSGQSNQLPLFSMHIQ